MNRVCITGNLTREPELRSTSSGTAVLNFGVAVNERRFNQQSQQWEDYAHFVDCVLFGKRAESLQRYMHRGDRVGIDGKLRYSSWESNGQKRSKLEVVVDDVDLLGGKRSTDQQATQQAEPADVYNDDIPF